MIANNNISIMMTTIIFNTFPFFRFPYYSILIFWLLVKKIFQTLNTYWHFSYQAPKNFAIFLNYSNQIGEYPKNII